MPFVMLLLGVALAEDKIVDVTCPVDGTKFKATEVGARPAFGGEDRDYCTHTFTHCSLDLRVWVCPTCAFAGLKEDFDSKNAPSEELKKKLAELKPAQKVADLPGHAKFDLLAQVRKAKGLGPKEVGEAYLWAAWSARHRGELDLSAFDEYGELITRYGLDKKPMDLGKENRSDYDLRIAKKIEKDIESKQLVKLYLTLAKFLAAATFRKHGELEAASRWLDDLAKGKGENSAVDGAVEKMQQTIETEKGFMKKALAEFQACLEQEKDAVKIGAFSYVSAELLRRLGEKKGAAAMYHKCLETCTEKDPKKIPLHIRWAKEQVSLVEEPNK